MKENFKWTGEQEAIFDWVKNGKGHLLARARAGCTKSSTSIEGLNRAKESNMGYLVFNKKNQLEAQEKIKNPLILVKTFHSLGYSFIAQNWRGVRGDAWAEYNRIKFLQSDAPTWFFFKTAQLVSYLKNTILNPSFADAHKVAIERRIDSNDVVWNIEKMVEVALKNLELSKEYPKDRKISFDDMLYLPISMGWVRKSFNLLFCDEGQDLNFMQYAMVEQSIYDTGRICLVADDRQSAYSWRGALSNGVEKFKQKFNAQELKLTKNFRCGKNIINFAKILVPDIEAHDGAIDGKVETITEENALNQIKVGDAILSRINAPLVGHCLSLIRQGTSAFIQGKDIVKTLENIIKGLKAENVNQFFDMLNIWEQQKIARATGWGANVAVELAQDQAATLRVIAESCVTVDDISKKLNDLFQDSDYVKKPSVVLSSIHRAKGLEWNEVYVLTDSFKVGRRKLTPDEAIEETNLQYISYTRPRNALYLVTPAKKPDKKNVAPVTTPDATQVS